MSPSAGSSAPRLGRSATRVAAISALGLIILLVILIAGASRESYTLRAVFDDVRGLIPGGDVTAGAIVVGTVANVELNDDGDPEVTMEINPGYRVHQGAFANIKLASNVGAVNRVVELSRGDPELAELDDGATLAGAATDNPVDFDLAASTLKPKVRANIKRILVGLDRSFRDRGPDFDRTLRHSALALGETSRLLRQVNEDGEALKTLIAEGSRVTGALAAEPELASSVDQLAAVLGTTGRRQAELKAAVGEIGPALAAGRDLLDHTREATPELSELVEGSRPLVEALGPFADVVRPASRAAGPFIAETRKLIEGAPDQLRRQRGLVQIAPPLLKSLDPMLARLNPIADYLRVWTPETVGFFQNVADAATGYDINGHMIRVASIGANTPPASVTAGGQIEPDECGPGMLASPYHRAPGVNECQPWTNWESTAIGGGG